MRSVIFGLTLVLVVSLVSGLTSSSYGAYSPQVKEVSSYDLIHNGPIIFQDGWHPHPLKLYYAEKFIPAVSSSYEIRLPYVLPASYKMSCQTFKHDGYYYVSTDLSCYS